MMSCSSRGSPPLRRSRNGCRECRRRHRRCDEAKPACSYCTGVGIPCEYARALSWGGRPFKRSRFGECFGQLGVVKIASESTAPPKRRKRNSRSSDLFDRDSAHPQFVYSSILSPIFPGTQEYGEMSVSSNGNDDDIQEINVSSIPPQETQVEETELSFEGPPTAHISTIPPELSLYPLPLRFRNLVGYFQFGMSRSFSCHPGIQNNICSALMPMAVTSSHLMAAILCASASHRLSIGLERLDDVIHLRSIAIQQLNSTFTSSEPPDWMTALGSSLVLCMSEMVSPEGTSGDWMVHLSGASALLHRLDKQCDSVNSSMQLLKQFYASIRAVVAGCGISDGKELFDEDFMKKNDYIDDFAGFSTSLVPIFESISTMDETRSRQESGSHDAYEACVNPILESQKLIERVRTMLMVRSIKFRPELNDTLSIAAKTDFGLLDEAYHHMALLQLFDLSEVEEGHLNASIQESVRRIISCIGAMTIEARPCPGVATLPPLFAAGCAATKEEDRRRILALLLHVKVCFGMGNVTSTCNFLKAQWGFSKRVISRRELNSLGFLPY